MRAEPIAIFAPFGFWSLLSVIIAIGCGALSFKDAGWAVRNNILFIRSRQMSRNTVIIPVNRIQSTEMRQSLMQKRKGLASFRVFAASGHAGTSFGLADAEEDKIVDLVLLPVWGRI